MRRILASSMAVALLFVISACSSRSPQSDLLPMVVASTTVTPSLTPSPKADPSVTRQTCRDAATAVAGATTSFQDQLDAIDHAAATGDHAAILIAADAIQTRLLSLAGLLSTWSRRAVPTNLRTTLTRGATTLRTICSESYPGDQSDIATQLQDLSRSLTRACG